MSKGSALPVPFIVGASRSGTTLLRLMLDAHPDLAIPSETHFGELWAPQTDSPLSREQLLESLVGCFTWPDFGLAPEALEAALSQIHPFNVGDGLRSFYSLYAASRGKRRWGDKTPDYVDIVDQVADILPEARFIHLIRDGRAVSESMARMHFNKLGQDFTALARLWKEKINRAREFSRRDAYLEVRYEDLVLRPRCELERICAFIKLPFDACMLEYWRSAESRLAEFRDWYGPDGNVMSASADRAKNHRLLKRPLRPERIDAWKTSLHRDAVAAIEDEAGDLLRDLGYRLKAATDRAPPA